MRRTKQLLGSLAAVATLLAIWQLGSYLVNKPILPSPWLVFQQLPLLFKGSVLQHLQASSYRVFLGMGLSILGGFSIGLLMGSLPKWQTYFDPLVYFTYPIPKMALLPIVMLLGGLGDQSKILMILLIVLPQMSISVRDAVREIPKSYYDVYRALRTSHMRMFWDITLPATLPAVFSATRISLGTAISILFFTENYGTEFGMGYFIMDSWTRMDYPSMYAGILMLSLFGFLLFASLDICSSKLFRWQKD